MGAEVFAGRVTFDPEVEQVWLHEGRRLHVRALEMLLHGQTTGIACYTLDGQKLRNPPSGS